MAKDKTLYTCTECGATSPRWLGKCPGCGAWNTLLETVAEAFNHTRHVLVEAGTGTGKSLGYLIPAAFWATGNGRRVVISTNTINLQDQLINT